MVQVLNARGVKQRDIARRLGVHFNTVWNDVQKIRMETLLRGGRAITEKLIQARLDHAHALEIKLMQNANAAPDGSMEKLKTLMAAAKTRAGLINFQFKVGMLPRGGFRPPEKIFLPDGRELAELSKEEIRATIPALLASGWRPG